MTMGWLSQCAGRVGRRHKTFKRRTFGYSIPTVLLGDKREIATVADAPSRWQWGWLSQCWDWL